MWRLETLQNSTATRFLLLLLFVPGIAIMLPAATRINGSVVGFTTANKEAAIDALRPCESERRLQYGLLLLIMLCHRVWNPACAFIENNKRDLKPRREFFAKIGDLEKCDGSVVPWIAVAAGTMVLLLFWKKSK